METKISKNELLHVSKLPNHKNNEVYGITLLLKITVFYKHVLQEINGYFKNFQ